MHHWCRQQGCVFDYRAKEDNLRFSVIPLNVTFVNIFDFCQILHKSWSNKEFQVVEKSTEGFAKDYGVKNMSENIMKAAY